MEHGRLPRMLIITAGYGEGHNSAARGVEEAMRGRAETRLVDLCAEAMPATFRMTARDISGSFPACPASGS